MDGDSRMSDIDVTKEDGLREALRSVIDPEIGMNVVELGLVRREVHDVVVDELCVAERLRALEHLLRLAAEQHVGRDEDGREVELELLEVGGGWLVWQTVRENKNWIYAGTGIIALIGYGFVPCLQPTSDFGRVYAVYGGFFIVLAFAWAKQFDGYLPDLGDLIGAGIALSGVLVIMLWPR